MEFKLVSTKETCRRRKFVKLNGVMMSKRSVTLSLNNLCKVEKEAGDNPDLHQICDTFRKKLENVLYQRPWKSAKEKLSADGPHANVLVDVFYNKATRNAQVEVRDKGNNGILAGLLKACESCDNLKIDVQLHLIYSYDVTTLEKKDVSKDEIFDAWELPTFELSFRSRFRSGCVRDFWNKVDCVEMPVVIEAEIELILKMDNKALDAITVGDLALRPNSNKEILDNAESTGDTTLVTKNGKEVRCHKVFLMIRVEAFNTMFKSDMKEAVSNRVNMKDMTEKGVRALLDYLYCFDLKEAINDSFTAVELLVAADKYFITTLFGDLKEVLLRQDPEWFSRASAKLLLSFGKLKNEGEENKWISKKATAVLKKIARGNYKNQKRFRSN